MKPLRFLVLLALAVGGLEFALRLSGQSLAKEVIGWLDSSDPGDEAPVDVAVVRRQLTSSKPSERRDAMRTIIGHHELSRQLSGEMASNLATAPDPWKVQLLTLIGHAGRGAAGAVEVAALASAQDATVRNTALVTLSRIVEHPLSMLPPVSRLFRGVEANRYEFFRSKGYAPELAHAMARHVLQTPALHPHYLDSAYAATGDMGPLRDAFALWWIEEYAKKRTEVGALLECLYYVETMGPAAKPYLGELLDHPSPLIQLRAAAGRINIDKAPVTPRDAALITQHLPQWASCRKYWIDSPDGGARVKVTAFYLDSAFVNAVPRLNLAPNVIADFALERMRCDRSSYWQPLHLIEKANAFDIAWGRLLQLLHESLSAGVEAGLMFSLLSEADKTEARKSDFVPLLVKAMESPALKIHASNFVWHLKYFGAAAAPALPALRRHLASQPANEQESTREAIDAIEKAMNTRRY